MVQRALAGQLTGRGSARHHDEIISAPAQWLRPRNDPYVRDALIVTASGVVGSGAANLAGLSGWSVPILGGGILAGAAQAAAGRRRARRHQLHDRLVEALAPLLGTRPDRRTVRLRRWTSGAGEDWIGRPRKITLRYAAGAPDHDPAWQATLLKTVEARLLAPYEVVQHDRIHATMRMRLIPPRERLEVPYAQQRAYKAITELIGPTVALKSAELEGEALTAITVSHQAGAKLAAGGYRNRVEKVVSTMMPGRWRAAWDLEGDVVRFEQRPILPASVWLPEHVPDERVVENLLRHYREVAIPYAIDEDGREIVWRPAVNPHLLLIGGTGMGKTSTTHAILGKITQYGWPVWVSDAKRVEFLDFLDWPNVQIVARSVPEQVALIHAVHHVMEHRYNLIEAGQSRPEHFEPLVVFLDEYAQFRLNLISWYARVKVKGDPTKPPTLEATPSLARLARVARIHLVVSLQRPDVEFLGGEMRDNFSERASMGRISPQGAMMMWENPAIGVTLPRTCVGRAMATHDDGQPVEVQCYRFPDLHALPGTVDHDLLQRLRPARAVHPRLLVDVPQERHDPETGTPIPPTFWDYARAPLVLASARPDLDPLRARAAADPSQGRRLSSPMASLGLTSPEHDSHPAGQTTAAAGDESTPDGIVQVEHPRESPYVPLGRPASTQPRARANRRLHLLPHPLESPEHVGEPWPRDLDDDMAGAIEVSHVDELTHAAGVAEDDDYTGYQPPIDSLPSTITVGDLIDVDDSGVWVVIDQAPEPDILAPGAIVLSWRGDADEAGVISIPEDTPIKIRRPEDLL